MTTLIPACAAGVLLAIAPSFAPAQDSSGAGQAAQTPPPRSMPMGVPGPEAGAAPPDEPIPGQTDPTVIERVRLEDLSLSAIVVASDPNDNIAMLEHEGVGYLVHKGSRIGSGRGIVREITGTAVIIEVPGAGPEGRSSTVELSLPQ
ncbi:MAG: hypothetical protein LBW85_07710 [Deltaproteobacteria bacterium]|nr:hypothetical protein [Deltaproteobacteria bacterium]